MNKLYTLSMTILILSSLIGMFFTTTLLHEYSHLRDYKNIEKNNSKIIINVPLTITSLPKNLGEYSFTYNKSKELDYSINKISAYTEYKAYTITFVVALLVIGSIAVILLSGNKCKFRKQCEYYKEENVTCNKDCGGDYCGKFRRIKDEK